MIRLLILHWPKQIVWTQNAQDRDAYSVYFTRRKNHMAKEHGNITIKHNIFFNKD